MKETGSELIQVENKVLQIIMCILLKFLQSMIKLSHNHKQVWGLLLQRDKWIQMQSKRTQIIIAKDQLQSEEEKQT
ncbi:unnamed protein product [Paramecium octaurelia]|uniref:Uncharacterized protein n=1 Tax=Paramecium octaurelia TaxID=43137 RepID=A0A8S1WNU4_PAROT|nr:unnamed protein product [Paramecium octaurelia]